MTRYAVFIIDMEKLPNEDWKKMWAEKILLYAAKIKEESYKKVTEAVDKIQDEELEETLHE